ncbi:hypothetical protein R1flu_004618 [Riccia fluitans]|uniref:Secreted protein n=1 Tax=Riccia fluitans TaxID=41844 RepID=A0ABD1YQU3_9MARC
MVAARAMVIILKAVLGSWQWFRSYECSGAASASRVASGSDAVSGLAAESRPISTPPPVDPVLQTVFEWMFAEFTIEGIHITEIPCVSTSRLSAIMATAVRSI